MSNQDHEGADGPSEASRPTSPDRLGPPSWGATVCDPKLGVLAWTEQFEFVERRGRQLVLIPRLCLGWHLTMRLLGRQPYHVAMARTVVRIPVHDVVAPFYVISATFPFYRTGEPALTGVALVLSDGRPLSLPEAMSLLKSA